MYKMYNEEIYIDNFHEKIVEMDSKLSKAFLRKYDKSIYYLLSTLIYQKVQVEIRTGFWGEGWHVLRQR